MPRPLDADDIDPLAAYRCQTDRMWRLTEFLTRFAPGFGETTGGTSEGRELVDEVTPLATLRDRNAAISAAFWAVEKIALNS